MQLILPPFLWMDPRHGRSMERANPNAGRARLTSATMTANRGRPVAHDGFFHLVTGGWAASDQIDRAADTDADAAAREERSDGLCTPGAGHGLQSSEPSAGRSHRWFSVDGRLRYPTQRRRGRWCLRETAQADRA